ncbi:acidic fibroblast growth factor intracellular-binding protein B-like [Styela clava]
MEIQPEIDIFVGNNTVIDMDVYDLWLRRVSATDAVKQHKIKGKSVTADLVLSDVLDQYRTLGLLEKYLKIPSSLGHQMSFQLTPKMQRELITRYYTFDETVIRELLGKKLSRNTYQSMDEIADKTGINLRSCIRQFDNCRRVFKAVEEIPGILVENIGKQFLLPKDLSWAYATVVFLANHRFECTKRKLSHMTLNNFITCSQVLIENWSYGHSESETLDMNVDIDREFLHDLRGVKFLASDRDLVDKCKECLIKNSAAGGSSIEAACKLLCRIIPTIASDLYHTKDLRDLFVDIVEKIVEPARVAKWSKTLMEDFLVNYSKFSIEHPQLVVFKIIWLRYINAINTCILQSYYC